MADIANTMKDLLNRSAKFIGRTFNTAASETKYKANEISINNKRRELVTELGKKVFELSNNGLVLPPEAAEIVEQIAKLDCDMVTLRDEHESQKAAAAERHAMEKAARAKEKAAAKVAAAAAQSASAEDVASPTEEVSVESEVEAPTAPTLEADEEAAAEEENKTDIPTLNV